MACESCTCISQDNTDERLARDGGGKTLCSGKIENRTVNKDGQGDLYMLPKSLVWWQGKLFGKQSWQVDDSGECGGHATTAEGGGGFLNTEPSTESKTCSATQRGGEYAILPSLPGEQVYLLKRGKSTKNGIRLCQSDREESLLPGRSQGKEA